MTYLVYMSAYYYNKSILTILKPIDDSKSMHVKYEHDPFQEPIIMSTTLGVTGLMNLGNTCFFNSVIQTLNHTSELKDYILCEKIKKFTVSTDDNKESYITYQIIKLFNNMWKGIPVIKPQSLLDLVHTKHSTMFPRSQQADAHELLKYILDDIHEEIGREVVVHFKNNSASLKKLIKLRNKYTNLSNTSSDKRIIEDARNQYHEYKERNLSANITYEFYKYWKKYIDNNKCSIITELFDSTILGTTLCSVCDKRSYAFTPNRILSLPIPNSTSSIVTLKQCLELYCKPEILSDDNKYKCSYCNKYSRAERELYIWRSSKILIIHLSRFIQIGTSFVKNNTTIHYPQELDIKPYISLLTTDTKKTEIKSSVYELFATVNHSGSINGGHYISRCKNKDNLWYEYDDSNVNRIPIQKILNDSSTYILYYRLK